MLEKTEGSPPEMSEERRAMRRFDMRLPAIVKVADASVDELTGRSPPAPVFR
jgi:hypothetical protein